MAGVAKGTISVPRNNSQSSLTADWRKNCPGTNGKLKYLLRHGLLTDVSFRVGRDTEKGDIEIIEAHKFMLAMFSSVFEAMFMGGFIENNSSVINTVEVTDIQPKAFKTLLQFIYLGELDPDLTTEDALGTLYAAKKYDISELEIECLQFLKQKISEENAVTIFEAAQAFGEKDLKDESEAFLRRNFDVVMTKDDFLNMSIENLCLFLRHDDTFSSELAIFKGVIRWAEAECIRQKVPPSTENMRNCILDALPLIRFPVISSQEIALEVIPTGILNLEEGTLLLQHKVVSPDSRTLLPNLPFIDQRRSFQTYKAEFYEEMKGMYVDLSAGWYNRFVVDQPISIVSFGFYGPHSKENATYDVEIKILRDDSNTSQPLGEIKYKSFAVKRKEIFHIKFLHPVPIQPQVPYRAWFSLDGPLTCHGGSPSASTIETIVPVNTRYEKVKFTYSVVGAHQLPEIMFQV